MTDFRCYTAWFVYPAPIMTPANTPAARTTPLVVTSYESKLLHNAQFLLTPREDAPNSIIPGASSTFWYHHAVLPRQLSTNAQTLLQQILAQGIVLYLTKVDGGWSKSFLRQGVQIQGRLWERHPLEQRAFHFSDATLNLLMWWTSLDPKNVDHWPAPNVSPASLTPTDEFLVFLLLDQVRLCHGAESLTFLTLASYPLFQANPWVWLLFPHQMPLSVIPINIKFQKADVLWDDLSVAVVPSWTPCLQGLRAIILEALQELLFQRLTQAFPLDWPTPTEGHLKQRETAVADRCDQFVRRCCLVYTVYRDFMQAAATLKRPDLAQFLLRAIAHLLEEFPQAHLWWEHIPTKSLTTVQARRRARRLALFLPQLILAFFSWTRYYQSIGFYDDDYRLAQWWLQMWEEYHGDDLVNRMQQFLDEADSPSESLHPETASHPS